jgi:hypothetical protein
MLWCLCGKILLRSEQYQPAIECFNKVDSTSSLPDVLKAKQRFVKQIQKIQRTIKFQNENKMQLDAIDFTD